MLKLVSSGRRFWKSMPVRAASSSSNRAGSRAVSGRHEASISAQQQLLIRINPKGSEHIRARERSTRVTNGAFAFSAFPELPGPEDRTGRDKLKMRELLTPIVPAGM